MALGFEEWEDWRKENSSKRPIRFFLAETVLDRVQDCLMFPRDVSDSLRSWWNNRFVAKTHFLKTGLEPGKFHELDERIMHGLFNEFVEFVEVDLAFMGAYEDKKRYRFVQGRCPEAGVDHLLWASSLTYGGDGMVDEGDPDYDMPTPQASASMDMLKLYRWWKEVRPARPNSHDESGWSDFYDKPYSEDKNASADRLQEIEDAYEREDDEMICLLVKIRRHLWT